MREFLSGEGGAPPRRERAHAIRADQHDANRLFGDWF